MMKQQRTRAICSPKLIAIFIFTRETVQIEVIIVSLNFHVNISEQFTICECIRPCFQGSVNMDLQQDVDEGDSLGTTPYQNPQVS